MLEVHIDFCRIVLYTEEKMEVDKMHLSLIVENPELGILAESSWEDEVFLVYRAEYAPGDQIKLTCGEGGQFLVVNFVNAIAPALIYMSGTEAVYKIPFGDDRKIYVPTAFDGERHYIHVRVARPEEISVRKNLALNPAATHGFCGMYPFASANVETRGEMVFAAKNAIDGVVANNNHGRWPYTSWGINRDPNAALKLEFGREVETDEIVLYLRADFPHDAWWEQASLHFSDGSDMTVKLQKTHAGQKFTFPKKKISWLVLDSLIKADDPSPFPALTQIEVWGTEA